MKDEIFLTDDRERGYFRPTRNESDERLLEYIMDVREGRVASGESTVRERFADDEGLMARCDTVDAAIQGQIDLFLDMLIIAQGEARAYRNLFEGLCELEEYDEGTRNHRLALEKVERSEAQLEEVNRAKENMGEDYCDFNKSRLS